ncbi:MAG TPA: T9SS type A sorting domain-containing protein [Saprospiraceae bacterium]|nr:T9SS type A sorting domain-containing protein [Saprospiraceae bacterium]
MRFLTFCIFLSSLCKLHGQDNTVFAPIGAVWHYNGYGHGSPPYFKFVVEKDTSFSDQNARLLRYYIFENDTFRTDNTLNKYIVTDGEKVYYRVENEFVLLFDFGAQPGDTIHSRVEDYPVPMGCQSEFENGPIDFSYVIDSLGTLDIDGIILRTQFVTIVNPPGLEPTWFLQDPIIERIGQIGLSNFWWGRGETCILEDNGFLRCYIDLDLTYVNPYFALHHDCDYTGTNEIEVSANNQIYPNPVDEIIYLNQKADLITIYNSSSQKIKSFITQDQIDVSDLQPGIYFLQYHSGNMRHVERFVKL